METAEGRTHGKSALYPAVPISVCYQFMKQIDSIGGDAVSCADILNSFGLASPSTKSFVRRISACRQYGFITKDRETVRLTYLAKRIVSSADRETEVWRLLVNAFRNPPLYRKLIERFKDQVVPPKDELSNILMNEYRIIKSVKDDAARCFIDSAYYLGLLKNGILCFEDTENDWNDRSNGSPVKGSNESPRFPHRESGYHFEIPTLKGKTAKFHIPTDVTEKDLEYIKSYIKDILPVFLGNLKLKMKQK